MAVSKVQFDGNTLIDLTGDTVTAAKLHSGYTAHAADGSVITGTYAPPSGSVTLNANGTYDVTNKASAVVAVAYNYKIFSYSSASAVGNREVTVVSGDPDVAAHYSDANAMVTIRKITNNNTNGLAFLLATNRQFPVRYGAYVNYNGTNNNAGTIETALSGSGESNINIKAKSNGDITVKCASSQNNFGGADYIVTFSW